jgi:outer membrane scaffolding protein for murein synthesis (MipA/OmpV family)
LAGLTLLAGGLCAAPALAQQEDDGLGEVIESVEPVDEEDSVFDDTWLGIGFGARVDTSYDGSDDYIVYPLPAAVGSIAGVGFSPRAAGVALDLLEVDLGENVEFSAGPVARLRQNRVRNIKDPVVEAAGKLDTAIEVGATFGITFKKILTKYDRISIGTDLRWDVNGAHRGFILDPGIAYRTPLSRGIVLGLTAGAQYADTDFKDYYYSVSPAQSAASGLPVFIADKGWYKAGASAAVGFDLDGDIENGGFVVGLLVGYSRMLGDARRTPYTSIRGSADQFYAATGIGYIF